jgi:hypothetical protein
MFLKALELREKVFGPEHSRVGQTLKHMITLYEMQVRFIVHSSYIILLIFFFFFFLLLLFLFSVDVARRSGLRR